MKLQTLFSSIIFSSILIFLAGSTITFAQTGNYKAVVAFTPTQFKFDQDNPAEYIGGYQGEFAGRVTGSKVKLYGLVNIERKLNVLQLDPHTYPIEGPVPAFDMVKRDTTDLGFGARLTVPFGILEPGVAAIAGTRFGNDVQPNKFSRRYQATVDVNLNKFFLRFGSQWARVTGNEGTEQSYLIGAGFRFK